MIECANCETAQYLNIKQSRVHFDDPVRIDTMDEVTEFIECTWCGGTGEYQTTPTSGVTLTGDLQEADKLPLNAVWDLSDQTDRESGHTEPMP